MDAMDTPSLDDIIIDPALPLSAALARLDKVGTGALVLCAPGCKLNGLLTDGDVRRALLRGVALDAPCDRAANPSPVFAPPDLPRREALQWMVQREIDQLPVVNAAGELQELLLRKVLVAEEALGTGVAERLDRVIIAPSRSIGEAIAQLDAAGTGALVLCSKGLRLAGLLSDGDIRRAILRGVSLEEPCGSIAMRKPFSVRHPLSNAEALRLMLERDINHLPVVDAEGNLYDLLLRRELAQEKSLNLSAVIMAGGFGKRLMPLTQQVPKPMLPVGDKPLLERTIEKLHHAGVRDVNLTTHYLPENIRQYFGDGGKFGVNLNYSQEDNPLGTAGGLRLLPRPEQPFVVINGDILTGVSFEKMLHFHQQHRARLTVGVRKYEVKVPFGVVECEDVRITDLREKPSLAFFINAGIYLLDPGCYDRIPEGDKFDMTDLIHTLLKQGETVVSFPILEYWLDIGRPEDYQQAQDDCREGRI